MFVQWGEGHEFGANLHTNGPGLGINGESRNTTTHVHISRTRTRITYAMRDLSQKPKTLPRTHAKRTPVLSSTIPRNSPLTSGGIFLQPVAPRQWLIPFCRLPVVLRCLSLLPLRQIPTFARYLSLFRLFGMSSALLPYRFIGDALLGSVQWFRSFGIFCSDVFRSADFCSGCRQSIGLGFCWERFGIRLGCPRFGFALRIYTKSS